MPGAARVNDDHRCPQSLGPVPHKGGLILAPCSPDIEIDYLPAARTTDKATCVVGGPDVLAMGCPTVFFNNQLAVRQGDLTAHGGIVLAGSGSVEIGVVGDGVAVMGIASPPRRASTSAQSSSPQTSQTPTPSKASTPQTVPSEASKGPAPVPKTPQPDSIPGSDKTIGAADAQPTAIPTPKPDPAPTPDPLGGEGQPAATATATPAPSQNGTPLPTSTPGTNESNNLDPPPLETQTPVATNAANKGSGLGDTYISQGPILHQEWDGEGNIHEVDQWGHDHTIPGAPEEGPDYWPLVEEEEKREQFKRDLEAEQNLGPEISGE